MSEKKIMLNKQKEFFNSSIIEMLLDAQKDKANFFVSTLDTKKIVFNSAFETRIDNEEKISYTIAEIQKVREALENDLMNSAYDHLIQPLSSLIPLIRNYKKNVSTLTNSIELEDFQNTIANIFSDSDIEIKDISNFVSQIEKSGEKSDFLVSAVKSKDFGLALLNIMFFIHYEKKYLDFLKTTLDGLKQPIKQITKDMELEKIEWQGTQKELAELFVELHKKGWIKEVNSNLIERYFTKSDTVKQILKPSEDKMGTKNYDGIYTKAYKPKFKSILPNIIKTKNL
jgi:hypothetical protein